MKKRRKKHEHCLHMHGQFVAFCCFENYIEHRNESSGSNWVKEKHSKRYWEALFKKGGI